jgi:pyridoxal phosphate enzyme (YggS family)
MGLTETFNSIKSKIPANVTLVAVSKTYPTEVIQEAYDLGQRVFGENRVQELTAKYEALPKDIEWHLIGHLQKNKVKYVAPFVKLIHAVDSLELLQTIENEGRKLNRKIPCLIQIHIAKEDTKFGLSPVEVSAFFESEAVKNLAFADIHGLMGMATFTDNLAQVAGEFETLANLFEAVKSKSNVFLPNFNQLSMGMSGDYTIAIEKGSTMVRIGSALFGAR